MEKIMAVVTAEKKYAERFCNYVNRRNNLAFTAVPFENLENYRQFCRKHKVDLVIADNDLARQLPARGDSYRGSMSPARLMVFDSGTLENYGTGEEGVQGSTAVIQKYQSADAIVRDIMANCEDMELRRSTDLVGRDVHVYGVYSPVGRSGKTSFALTLAGELAREEKVLYINFEEFSGLEVITGESCTQSLSDAMYHMKQGTLTLQKLDSMIHHYGKIDYLPPVQQADDMKAVSGKDHTELIMQILKLTDYRVIVADMSAYANLASEVMDLCDRIFMPVLEDPVSRRKAEDFENFLEISGRGNLIPRICRFCMPKLEHSPYGPVWLDHMLYSPVGDLVRNMIGSRTEHEQESEF